MTLIRKVFSILVISSFLIPVFMTESIGQESMRQGDKSLCKIGSIMRRVEIHYYEKEKAVPCEVHYYKDTEEPGSDQILWRAENQTGYCENKMTAFVDDLSGFGWYCETDADIPPSLQPEGTSE